MGGLGTSSYRWIILLLATLVQVGVSILQQAPAALEPVLTRDLELSRSQVGILSAAIWGGMLLAMLPVGLMIDRHGERRLIMAGVATMALLVLWATQFGAFAWLLVLFLLASLGASTSAPGGSKEIAAWFPHSQRGGAIGMRQTGVTIGGLMAVFLLPHVAVRFGWEVGLELAAGVALFTVFCFAMFYWKLPADADADGEAPSPRVQVGKLVKAPGFLATSGYAFVLMGVQGSSAFGHAAMYAPQASFLSELFGTRVRYSGASIGYQLAPIIGGGIAPFIAVALLHATGSYWPVAVYMIGMALITVVSVFLASETSFSEISDVNERQERELVTE